MTLLALGINHKTAPVALRERVTFSPETLDKALEQGGDAQEIMQDLARKLTNRLIHAPTKSLQQAARDGDDERLHILRNSLGLE